MNNMVENENNEDNQYEVTRLELVGGHAPRAGLEQEDVRPMPAQEDMQNAIGDMLDILEELTTDTVMEEDFVSIISGFTTSLHYVLGRLERKQDDTQSELRRLMREFDGSEVRDHQMQQQTNLMKQNDERVEGLEALRDMVADFLITRYQQPWQPPRGSLISGKNLKHASIVEAKEFIKARETLKNEALTPKGTRVAFAGGKEYQDYDAIWKALDSTLNRHPDMVLVHGGAPGSEEIASKWAINRKVSQIVCKPDWAAHQKAAPFKRNDDILKLDIIGLIAAPGTGITDNLVDKVRENGIMVYKLVA